jgi:dephospho-CoA kinase
MALIIGLTGGIASGKSTITAMFRKRGIPVIDADIVAREVVFPGQEAYEKIVSHFGMKIIGENKFIDRKLLGEMIFNDEKERKVLNNIVHPAVRARMNDEKETYIKEGHETVVMDIPLLFESNLTHLVHKILLVYVHEDVQLKRLMKRNQLTLEEATARINSQMKLNQKRNLADEIIDNNGTVHKSEQQLEHILKKWEINV